MNRVHSDDEKPFNDLQHAGVAIGAVDAEQRHIGMLHRDVELNKILMLDLAWHHELRNKPPNQKYLWVDPPFHPKRLVQVAAICRRILKANKKDSIPYAFSPPNDCFDSQTGSYLFGPTKFGLTCASFVLAVFHTAGLQIINYQSWPLNRDSDKLWQEKIIALLKVTGASEEHIQAVRDQVGCARYRPEEVAGAATENSLPVNFNLAEERGQQILDRLNK